RTGTTSAPIHFDLGVGTGRDVFVKDPVLVPTFGGLGFLLGNRAVDYSACVRREHLHRRRTHYIVLEPELYLGVVESRTIIVGVLAIPVLHLPRDFVRFHRRQR